MQLLSLVVPCYNEEENIDDFYEEAMKQAPFFEDRQVSLEIVYIDDGSSDHTAERVRALHERDERVRLVSFSRNFGKEAAIYAGLSRARGDIIALLDCDLQDPPSLLPQMYTLMCEEGCESVATRRVSRKGEPRIRSFFISITKVTAKQPIDTPISVNMAYTVEPKSAILVTCRTKQTTVFNTVATATP